MTEQRQQEIYMEAAFNQAMKARMIDEVPVGAVIVYEGKIIARAHNRRETKKPMCSRGTIGNTESCQKVKELAFIWYRIICDPGTMPDVRRCNHHPCIDRVYFGAYDPKAGAFWQLIDLNTYGLNHKPEIVGGILQDRCSLYFKRIFQAKRQEKRKLGIRKSLLLLTKRRLFFFYSYANNSHGPKKY